MLYLYAISDSPRRPDVPGLQGAAVLYAGQDGLHAVWSEHEDRIDAHETALWEHEQVVEALLEDGTVLPMRFGGWMSDRAAMRDLLVERREEFELGLERVRGAVEIGVRALVCDQSSNLDPVASERPGTAYMLARLSRQKRSEAITAHIHEPLRALSRASSSRRTSLGESVNTAYLVGLDDVDPFRATVERLDGTVEHATIVCTGPWPPYSFTPSEPAR